MPQDASASAGSAAWAARTSAEVASGRSVTVMPRLSPDPFHLGCVNATLAATGDRTVRSHTAALSATASAPALLTVVERPNENDASEYSRMPEFFGGGGTTGRRSDSSAESSASP